MRHCERSEAIQRAESSAQKVFSRSWRVCWIATSLTLLAMTAPSHAALIKTYVGNGTGFYVSDDGYILTNQHVVPYCKRLTVSGATGTREATVVARDSTNDLALLKAAVTGSPFGVFSSQKTSLAKGDRVVIVGFPGASVDPVTRDSEIQRVDVPGVRTRWIGLGDVVEKGNSGGPVFDSAGNIIGVVSARAELLTYNKKTKEEVAREDFGAAIALPLVENFLSRSGVRYRISDSDMYLPTSHITANAVEFLVKVRCEYKTEVQ
jgi:S1-C subfamily serine protease